MALSFTRLSSPLSPITVPCSSLLSPAPMGSVSLKISATPSVSAAPSSSVRSRPHRRPMLASPCLSPAPAGSVSLKISDDTVRFCCTIILHKIEASERRLHQIERDLAGYETLDPAKPDLPPELMLVLARHPLPLGRDSRFGITTMLSSIARSYARPAAVALLSTFMSYRHATSCPTTDPLLLSKLISKACETLLRRRPLPQSFWKTGTPTPRAPFQGVHCLWVVPGWQACHVVPSIAGLAWPKPGLCRA